MGSRTIDLVSAYPPAVREAMSTGRVTRVAGGVVELVGVALPADIVRQGVAWLQLEDVYVVGFAKGSFAGGICIICREPAMVLRCSTIEALARLTATAIDRKRARQRCARARPNTARSCTWQVTASSLSRTA